MIKDVPKIPMTVIGGFLGAGKTTFLNHLLTSGKQRYAVLVNDFGEINIDAALIARHDGATMTLANGCICCSTASGFFKTLIHVLDSKTPYDHIIIESSGVGDPWRIAEIALIESVLRLNALITIVDTSRIVSQLKDSKVADTVRSQLMHSDIILLNKIDLVKQTEIDRAQAAIGTISEKSARMVTMSQGSMPTMETLSLKTSPRDFHCRPVSQVVADHEAQFCRWVYQREGSFDRTRFAAAIASLPGEVRRLKGSCRFSDEATTVVFQFVERVWSLSPIEDLTLPYDITLVGVGTHDMPSSVDLDRILDRALVA